MSYSQGQVFKRAPDKSLSLLFGVMRSGGQLRMTTVRQCGCVLGVVASNFHLLSREAQGWR
jgi:hypothetical protein